MTPPAAMSFQMISNWVTSPWTPTGKVIDCGVAVRMKAKRNSAQSKAKTITPAARTPVEASGSRTCRKACKRVPPSTRAASSTSAGICSRKPLSIQMASGRLKIV